MTTLELSQPPPVFLHPTAISAQSYMYTTTYSQYQQRLYLLVVCGIFFTVKRERMPCGAAVSVLLFLLWSLVEVHCQTVPNLTFMGETLPDHSYVDLSALGELDNVDDYVVCHTDLASCCGGDGRYFYNRGFWYFPNGAELPGAMDDGSGAANNPIVLRRGPQYVRLIRGTGPGDAPSGLYRCIIETVAYYDSGNPRPDNGIGETLYVGVYSTGG